MPSQALLKFEGNLLVEVERLIQSHSDLNHDGRGRRGLGHITRSGVFMLCAAWELYVEELLSESVRHLTTRCSSPDELPLLVRKELANHVKLSKHELKPLELAGQGWEGVLTSHVDTTLSGLNTPKSHVLNPLFKKFVGLGEFSSCWTNPAKDVNDFVTARGDIAHRGRDTNYVTIGKLHDFRDMITRTVLDSDNGLADHLQSISPGNKSPWRRRAI